jgi:hypothetical protein
LLLDYARELTIPLTKVGAPRKTQRASSSRSV